MSCLTSANRPIDALHKNGCVDACPPTAAQTKSLEMMTCEEFRQALAMRETRRPTVSFSEFLHQKGYTDRDTVSSEEYADFFGGAITRSTGREKGKLKSLTKIIARKLELTRQLDEEYKAAVASGEIPSEVIRSPLTDHPTDLAYARIQQKRILRRAIAEGRPVYAGAQAEYPELFR